MRTLCLTIALAVIGLGSALSLAAQESATESNRKPTTESKKTASEGKKAGGGDAVQKPNRQELEQQFSEKMSGVTLVGHFTDRTAKEKALKEEKYTLGKVSKIDDDYWRFEARIQYGNHDVTLPLSLRVAWARDTPVITMDKVLIPGFGTFTCRVMFFEDQYAGTWEGGNHGGHLFGRLVRDGDKANGKETESKDSPSK